MARTNMITSISLPQRKLFARVSIFAGNSIQLAGLSAAGAALAFARSTLNRSTAVAALIAAWILIYFFCHGIAHWAVGRTLGIRFVFYSIGGTGNPGGYPRGLRWLFEHLPFFGVQTDKASMQKASPMAKAIMWSAGVTSSALLPTLCALYGWSAHIPGSKPFVIFAAWWAIGTLSSNWRSPGGDFAKARRALSTPPNPASH